MKLKFFADDLNPQMLDRESFSFSHKLSDHPALTMENILKVIPTLPKDKVMFSKNLNDVSLNFDTEFSVKRKELDLAAVIENMVNDNSYIAARNLELNDSFKDLYEDLINDVRSLLKANKRGTTPLEPMLWLFISSPNTIAPFHFDRFSNIIMQIRGSKELAVFPPRVEEIISKKETESYLDWTSELPPWRDELDQHAHKYHFKKGEAVHIPFVSGHYVKNGSEDISVSLSLFFHSDETLRWSKAMRFNNRLSNFGFSSRAVGDSQTRDNLKADLLPFITIADRARNKIFR